MTTRADVTKTNLLVFLTPHVIRSRDDLQALAIDERQKYVRTLGRTEINNMPASQFEKLYQPTFNAPISPQQDLMQTRPLTPNNLAPAPGMAPAASFGNSSGAGAGSSSMYPAR